MFTPKDENGKVGPFCMTSDLKAVRYQRSNDYHFLDRENGDGLKLRLERLHWVKPVIEQNVIGENLMHDNGKKRIYYMPQVKYVVILNYDKSGQLWLNSAYKVTERYMRKKMEALFGL